MFGRIFNYYKNTLVFGTGLGGSVGALLGFSHTPTNTTFERVVSMQHHSMLLAGACVLWPISIPFNAYMIVNGININQTLEIKNKD